MINYIEDVPPRRPAPTNTLVLNRTLILAIPENDSQENSLSHSYARELVNFGLSAVRLPDSLANQFGNSIRFFDYRFPILFRSFPEVRGIA